MEDEKKKLDDSKRRRYINATTYSTRVGQHPSTTQTSTTQPSTNIDPRLSRLKDIDSELGVVNKAVDDLVKGATPTLGWSQATFSYLKDLNNQPASHNTASGILKPDYNKESTYTEDYIKNQRPEDREKFNKHWFGRSDNPYFIWDNQNMDEKWRANEMAPVHDNLTSAEIASKDKLHRFHSDRKPAEATHMDPYGVRSFVKGKREFEEHRQHLEEEKSRIRKELDAAGIKYAKGGQVDPPAQKLERMDAMQPLTPKSITFERMSYQPALPKVDRGQGVLDHIAALDEEGNWQEANKYRLMQDLEMYPEKKMQLPKYENGGMVKPKKYKNGGELEDDKPKPVVKRLTSLNPYDFSDLDKYNEAMGTKFERNGIVPNRMPTDPIVYGQKERRSLGFWHGLNPFAPRPAYQRWEGPGIKAKPTDEQTAAYYAEGRRYANEEMKDDTLYNIQSGLIQGDIDRDEARISDMEHLEKYAKDFPDDPTIATQYNQLRRGNKELHPDNERMYTHFQNRQVDKNDPPVYIEAKKYTQRPPKENPAQVSSGIIRRTAEKEADNVNKPSDKKKEEKVVETPKQTTRTIDTPSILQHSKNSLEKLTSGISKAAGHAREGISRGVNTALETLSDTYNKPSVKPPAPAPAPEKKQTSEARIRVGDAVGASNITDLDAIKTRRDTTKRLYPEMTEDEVTEFLNTNDPGYRYLTQGKSYADDPTKEFMTLSDYDKKYIEPGRQTETPRVKTEVPVEESTPQFKITKDPLDLDEMARKSVKLGSFGCGGMVKPKRK